MNENFDSHIETELRASLARVVSAARPPALQSLLERKAPSFLAIFGRRLSASTAAGVAAAALAVAGGGYAAASVANGTANPTVWGQQVRQQVEACQDQRASDTRIGHATEIRGIGSCVSTFARQNGEAHRDLNASSHPSPPAKGEGGQPGSSGGGHGKSAPEPKAHPTPGHGRPSPKA